MSGRIQGKEQRVNELLALHNELNQKFSSHVSEDFSAQTDNLFNPFHRTEAMKVFYVRKKLTKSIDSKQKALEAMKSEYCAKCINLSGEFAHQAYCSHCPSASLCQVAPSKVPE